MAPTKGTTRTLSTNNQQQQQQQAKNNTNLPMAAQRRGLLTRRAAAIAVNDHDAENMQTRAKRKAELSPIKNEKIKRSALGNLTNNVKIMTLHPNDEDAKSQQLKKPTAQQLQALVDAKKNDNLNAIVSAAAAAAAAATSSNTNNNNTNNNNKILTRAASIRTEDAIENCHRVLDELEESLARPKRRVQPKKPLAPAGGDLAIGTAPQPMAAPAVIPPLPPAVVAAIPPLAPVAKAKLSLPVPAVPSSKPVRRISNDFNKTEESLYMSALEDVSASELPRLSGNFELGRRRSAKLIQKTDDQPKQLLLSAVALAVSAEALPQRPIPDDVEDFDRKNWDDVFQVSHYAMDIFEYLKKRECEFPIADYMTQQVHLTPWMRTLLVDWMVEVQETFELNHETLYLAVKIVDLYLCREVILKEKLQLLGAAAFFIACKYDERQPPMIDDFLYICDGAYERNELVKMEMETLRIINYDLGIPLSYRFLRRYARCAKIQMPTLTLARYILEMSLMDYATISFSDSQLAAATLFMALRMHGGNAELDNMTWTSTLQHYTGYELADFAELVPILNAGLHRKPRNTIKTIRNKYSHKIFHEVAKVPLLSNKKLFQNNLDFNTSDAT